MNRRLNYKKHCYLVFQLACCLIFFLSGCSKHEKELPKSTISIQVLYPNEIQDYLTNIQKQFASTSPSLDEGSLIKLQLTPYASSFETAQNLASGKVKTDLWISPSSSLVNYTNASLSNLGPKQESCVSMFASPIILAVPKSRKRFFPTDNNIISWNEIYESKIKKVSISTNSPFMFNYSHTLPLKSASGLDSLIQLAYFAANKRDRSLDSRTLNTQYIKNKLKNYEHKISSYGTNINGLFHLSDSEESNRARIVLATEQEMVSYNAKNNNEKNQYVALYPVEGSFWQDFTACTSSSDWVTPAKLSAIQVFSEFLKGSYAQSLARQFGFRSAHHKTGAPGLLTRDLGVNLKLPSSSFQPVAGDVVAHLVKNWSYYRKPNAVVLVLDRSSSMEGMKEQLAKESLSIIAAKTLPNDLRGLVSFSTTVDIATPLTTDSASIIQQIDSLRSIGGSAVYDSIKSAIEILTSNNLEDYRKSIILITDGEDKNSHYSALTLSDLIRDKFTRHDITIYLLAFKEQKPHNDLQYIAEKANGYFYEINQYNIHTLIAKIAKGL